MKVRHLIVGGGNNITEEMAEVIVNSIISSHSHGVDDVEVTVIPGSAALTWLSDDLT